MRATKTPAGRSCRRHERSVYNLLARMLRNPAHAQDITQDGFIRTFRHLTSFDPAHKFSNWILRIARNATIDAIRRREPAWVPLDEMWTGRRRPPRRSRLRPETMGRGG